MKKKLCTLLATFVESMRVVVIPKRLMTEDVDADRSSRSSRISHRMPSTAGRASLLNLTNNFAMGRRDPAAIDRTSSSLSCRLSWKERKY